MAFTSVVTSRFYRRMIGVLQQLEADTTGPLLLAMLVPVSLGVEAYSLVLASYHLDSLGLSDGTMAVLAKLRELLVDEASKIDTVSIRRTNSLAVRTLGDLYDIPELELAYLASNVPSSILDLDEAILFVSRALPVAA